LPIIAAFVVSLLHFVILYRLRVPVKWGQMLGGIVFYAILGQLPILLPALFIVLAATAFSVLGDGLRAASDPFSRHRVRPATFGRPRKGTDGVLLLERSRIPWLQRPCQSADDG